MYDQVYPSMKGQVHSQKTLVHVSHWDMGIIQCPEVEVKTS